MGIIEKFRGKVDLEAYAKDGSLEMVELTENVFTWTARNTNGDVGIALSSREATKLREIMEEMDRPLMVVKDGRGGEHFKIFVRGKQHSVDGAPSAGFRTVMKDVVPHTSRFAFEGVNMPPALVGAKDPMAALEGLKEHDAATGVGQLEDGVWKEFLSGADDIVFIDKSSYGVRGGTVKVRMEGGQFARLKELEAEEFKLLHEMVDATSLRKHVERWQYGGKPSFTDTYVGGVREAGRMPMNVEVLMPEIAEICEGAVRMVVTPWVGGLSKFEAYSASGIRRGGFSVDGEKFLAARSGLDATDLLVEETFKLDQSIHYSQFGKDFSKEEFDRRRDGVLTEPPAPAVRLG